MSLDPQLQLIAEHIGELSTRLGSIESAAAAAQAPVSAATSAVDEAVKVLNQARDAVALLRHHVLDSDLGKLSFNVESLQSRLAAFENETTQRSIRDQSERHALSTGQRNELSAIRHQLSLAQNAIAAVETMRPRGTWKSDSEATARGDVFERLGSAYVALKPTKQPPSRGASDWMLLAARGGTVSGGSSAEVAAVEANLSALTTKVNTVIDAYSIGVRPSNDSTTNLTNLNTALSASTVTVRFRESGEYLFDGPIVMYSGCTLEMIPGVNSLGKDSSAAAFTQLITNYASAEANYTAQGAYDTDITLRGVTINTNGVDQRGHEIKYGLIGQIAFYRVSRLKMHYCKVNGEHTDTLQFGTQLVRVLDFDVFDYEARINKDGFHINGGCRGTFRKGLFNTSDDAIGYVPHEYPDASPEILGSAGPVHIYDITDEYYEHAAPVGNTIRLEPGSWAVWYSGYQVRRGTVCVNSAGQLYQCLNSAPGADTSKPFDLALLTCSIEPTHTNWGSVTGADGVTWRHKGAGTHTEASIGEVYINGVYSERRVLLANVTTSAYNCNVAWGTEHNSRVESVQLRNYTCNPPTKESVIPVALNCDIGRLILEPNPITANNLPRQLIQFSSFSYAAAGNPTFDESTAVNTTTDQITVTNHGLIDDQIVRYRAASGVGGLNDYREYRVIVVDANTIQLAHYPGGSAIDLTSTGTGTATLLAWDGCHIDELIVENLRTETWRTTAEPMFYFNTDRTARVKKFVIANAIITGPTSPTAWDGSTFSGSDYMFIGIKRECVDHIEIRGCTMKFVNALLACNGYCGNFNVVLRDLDEYTSKRAIYVASGSSFGNMRVRIQGVKWRNFVNYLFNGYASTFTVDFIEISGVDDVYARGTYLIYNNSPGGPYRVRYSTLKFNTADGALTPQGGDRLLGPSGAWVEYNGSAWV